MKKDIARQVRYNIKTATGDQEFARHRWTFMIINTPDEIKRIRERVYQQLAPVVECKNLYNEPISNSNGLHGDFFSFSTYKMKIEDTHAIYDAKNFKKDRNLKEGNDVVLSSYLEKILNENKSKN